ncbi:hypothetical protein ADL28_25340 [Streptomyces violaceusniger]|uniref:Uncharacterized protein n=2 Tax=Streptomyces violaceusniger group TaxID=2839105 RepID=A0ABD5J0S7_9ACTN|nr:MULTISPECIES: hypothetical protein [Streptomyces]MEE4581821.1 hypothetical protein [Streptomyces sp. DSM 41602]WTA85635.1 hypothetical protein OG751_40475 [Streptomyces antimycoticus]KUL50597.1 hypothetical protein ADL28_25340 [Streptomyces violaceusniger]QTI89934.1 hypothetical protein AS97_56735 [Streptomyces sp. AgN23]RSS47455.1 hypothetical protein EF902_09510 [Streptomyces sp. WAC05858]
MTVHEDLAQGFLEDFQKEPSAMTALLELRDRHISGDMNEGDIYGTGYADALGSSARFAPKQWPLHQHAAFLELHALVGSGAVTYTCISTGGAPGADADREGNAAKLAQTHPRFTAHLDMTQNGADADGTLRWEGRLEVSRPTGAFFYGSACRNASQSILVKPANVAASSVPLEVGDSWPSRTLMHLIQYGAVARWPYGSKLIWLFLNFNRGVDWWGDRPRRDAPAIRSGGGIASSGYRVAPFVTQSVAPFWGYIREADKWTDAASEDIGL